MKGVSYLEVDRGCWTCELVTYFSTFLLHLFITCTIYLFIYLFNYYKLLFISNTINYVFVNK